MPSEPAGNPIMPTKERSNILAEEMLAAMETEMRTHKISTDAALQLLSEIDCIDDIGENGNAVINALIKVRDRYPEETAHGEAFHIAMLALKRKRDAERQDGLKATVSKAIAEFLHSISDDHDRH